MNWKHRLKPILPSIILILLLLSFTIGFGATTVGSFVLKGLLITSFGTLFLYFIFFYVLRSIFRQFEHDIALVILNISAYPALVSFLLFSLRVTFKQLIVEAEAVENIVLFLNVGLIIALTYWLIRFFNQVVIYYLKELTQQSEAMWDDVLLPLLEAVIPVILMLLSGALILSRFGINLTGIWVTLGGATFVIGFAVKDILANFFSGIVLLIDTPFQFGDVLELEDGSVGILQRIGVRVTKLYMFDNHCNVYIPNSVLQGQSLKNLSRPTAYYYYSTTVQVRFQYDADTLKQVMEEVLLAHPDILGNVDTKLEVIKRYFRDIPQEKMLAKQQKIGEQRLEAEQAVNLKLEEIDLELASIVVTIQFAEKGGLTSEEIENIQMEYHSLLDMIGLSIKFQSVRGRKSYNFYETEEPDTLIELVRNWYRISIRDPNLLDQDEELISTDWERRIKLLKRRSQRVYQKIARPEREETRIDDYVLELRQWIKERFKAPRTGWQDPQVLVTQLEHDEGHAYLNFKLNFFVDDIKLENGRRGDRVSSQVYQEIVYYLKNVVFY